MTEYFRPILNTDLSIPDNAQVMRGTHFWFTHAEKLARNTEPQIVLAKNIPDNILQNITSERDKFVDFLLMFLGLWVY